jgi:high-affinity nickel-transport protein
VTVADTSIAPAPPGSATRRVGIIYAALLAGNAVAWLWALAVFHDNPLLIGTAVLAYVFGLRHAVDADHIAAIDNVTRKLMQMRQKPVTVGLYFSLGHSTVVVLACAGIAMTSVALRAHFAAFRDIGSVVGTSVSAAFLLMIALANIVTLVSVHRAFRAAANGETPVDVPLVQGGILGRILRPLMNFISQPWHMYLLGFLFGLGFDTATEVGLLGISATQASQNVPLWSIMIFPALFTAGMSLVDTTDGVVMVGAYGWAFVKPMRKLLYNLAITLISITVALIVGVLEALNLIADKFSLNSGFWRWIGNLNDHFGAIGCFIIASLIACWAISMLIYRRSGEAEIRNAERVL